MNDRQLQNEGFCKISVLNAVDIQRLTDALLGFQEYYYSTPELFVSTMLVPDATHRRSVHDRIVEVVGEQIKHILSGFDILFSNLLVKHPGEAGAVGVHTDWTYVDESLHNSYNLWIPLVDVGQVNGCLHVWPKSHAFTPKVRPTPYVPLSREDEQTVYLHSVPMELTAGQGVLYHSGLIHFSNPNYSDSARPALAMVLIPVESRPVHYFRDSDGETAAYDVDGEFFFNHVPGIRPSHQMPREYLNLPDFSLEEALQRSAVGNTGQVSRYYDEWSPAYQEVYGDVIQAFRPESETVLLDHIVTSAGLEDGQAILDAGCGTCGPAVYFAGRRNLSIDAITVSDVQVKRGLERIRSAGLDGRVTCRNADFRFMPGIGRQSKDGVLFLEALGHCPDLVTVMNTSYKILKDRGFLYIKDFFYRESRIPMTAERIRRSVQNINEAYAYNVMSLPKLIETLSAIGFVIDFIRPLSFSSDTRIRAEFESRFGISVFEGGEFELAQWLEIRAVKHFPENER